MKTPVPMKHKKFNELNLIVLTKLLSLRHKRHQLIIVLARAIINECVECIKSFRACSGFSWKCMHTKRKQHYMQLDQDPITLTSFYITLLVAKIQVSCKMYAHLYLFVYQARVISLLTLEKLYEHNKSLCNACKIVKRIRSIYCN